MTYVYFAGTQLLNRLLLIYAQQKLMQLFVSLCILHSCTYKSRRKLKGTWSLQSSRLTNRKFFSGASSSWWDVSQRCLSLITSTSDSSHEKNQQNAQITYSMMDTFQIIQIICLICKNWLVNSLQILTEHRDVSRKDGASAGAEVGIS